MVTEVHSPLVPLMVREVPVLYSPRMDEEVEGPERSRTYMALMYPVSPSPIMMISESVSSVTLR